jgi:hypothetical protein
MIKEGQNIALSRFRDEWEQVTTTKTVEYLLILQLAFAGLNNTMVSRLSIVRPDTIIVPANCWVQ